MLSRIARNHARIAANGFLLAWICVGLWFLASLSVSALTASGLPPFRGAVRAFLFLELVVLGPATLLVPVIAFHARREGSRASTLLTAGSLFGTLWLAVMLRAIMAL